MAKTDNNTASIGFEQQIWAAADILRGNMEMFKRSQELEEEIRKRLGAIWYEI